MVLALLLTLCPSTPARAGGSTMSIFGGRRMGMMANLGRPDDPTALFHMPAGLADQPGQQLYVFISPAFLSTDFRMKAHDPKRFPNINPDGCGKAGAAPCPWPIDEEGYYTKEIEPEKVFGVLPYVGATTDLGFVFGPGGRDIVVGMALYSPNFYGAFMPEDAPSAYHVIGGMFLVGRVTVGAGWRINRLLAVGANFSYNYMALSMAQKLSLANSLTPPGQDPSTGFGGLAQNLIGDLKMEFDGRDHGIGWGLSVLLTPLPWLSFGVAYAGSTTSYFEGDVSFTAYKETIGSEQDLRELAGQVGYKLPTRLSISQGLPHSLHFGVAASIGSRVELGLDVRLWFYNLMLRQILQPSYDDGPGKEPLTKESLSRDKDFELSWQVAAGVLFRPFASHPGLELMVGAGYDQSPLPDHTYTLDNPNLSHAKLSVGVRWRINPRWRLSAGYLLNLYISRDITNSETSPPTNVQVSSHSHSPALAMTYAF